MAAIRTLVEAAGINVLTVMEVLLSAGVCSACGNCTQTVHGAGLFGCVTESPLVWLRQALFPDAALPAIGWLVKAFPSPQQIAVEVRQWGRACMHVPVSVLTGSAREELNALAACMKGAVTTAAMMVSR